MQAAAREGAFYQPEHQGDEIHHQQQCARDGQDHEPGERQDDKLQRRRQREPAKARAQPQTSILCLDLHNVRQSRSERLAVFRCVHCYKASPFRTSLVQHKVIKIFLMAAKRSSATLFCTFCLWCVPQV